MPFALQYRTGGADVACEDLAAAITFIFEHAEELGVSTDCYSLGAVLPERGWQLIWDLMARRLTGGATCQGQEQ